MNTNPTAITVLCYGDSNTYGQRPDKKGRFEANQRWTGLLQEHLGANYYVIEEGLNSRTTELDYAKKPGRNGRSYWVPCLQSHHPLHHVIIMLGTNDVKKDFNRSVIEIADSLRSYIADVREHAVAATEAGIHIILVGPVPIDGNAPFLQSFYSDSYDDESIQKSHQLPEAVLHVAQDTGVTYIDAASVAMVGEDGLHLSLDGHAALAKLLANTITKFRT